MFFRELPRKISHFKTQKLRTTPPLKALEVEGVCVKCVAGNIGGSVDGWVNVSIVGGNTSGRCVPQEKELSILESRIGGVQIKMQVTDGGACREFRGVSRNHSSLHSLEMKMKIKTKI
jgi:hypothetical protein